MKNRGFTLLELIIVIIIIGILASIAAPMMKSMKVKAMLTEGLTGFSSIKLAVQKFYIENGVYPWLENGGWDVQEWPGWLSVIRPGMFLTGLSLRSVGSEYGATATDGNPPTIDGTYFSQECYTLSCEKNNWRILVLPQGSINDGPNKAPKRQDVINTTDSPGAIPGLKPCIYIDAKTGKITQMNWSQTGYDQYTSD